MIWDVYGHEFLHGPRNMHVENVILRVEIAIHLDPRGLCKLRVSSESIELFSPGFPFLRFIFPCCLSYAGGTVGGELSADKLVFSTT